MSIVKTALYRNGELGYFTKPTLELFDYYLLENSGYLQHESYGRDLGETLVVWVKDDGQHQEWIVEYSDLSALTLYVVISDPLDFLDFQRSYIAPIATKIMAAEQHLKNENLVDQVRENTRFRHVVEALVPENIRRP